MCAIESACKVLIIEDLLRVGDRRVGLLDRAATLHAISEILYLSTIFIIIIIFRVGLLSDWILLVVYLHLKGMEIFLFLLRLHHTEAMSVGLRRADLLLFFLIYAALLVNALMIKWDGLRLLIILMLLEAGEGSGVVVIVNIGHLSVPEERRLRALRHLVRLNAGILLLYLLLWGQVVVQSIFLWGGVKRCRLGPSIVAPSIPKVIPAVFGLIKVLL